ncbi:hypothetical protein EC957_002215, partial [Mortierella hygrophila]
MTAAMTASSTTRLRPHNPFNLPELRNKISRFVTLKDDVAYARVSKARAQNYLPFIWHSIDCNYFSHSNISSGFDIVD